MILSFIIKSLSRLPMWFLYLISDFIFFMLHYVTGYRKKVILDNLKKAFPDKSPHELNQILRGFNRHFADFIVETLKNITDNAKFRFNRFYIKNLKEIEELHKQGKNIVAISGHYGNWEVLTAMGSYFPYYPFYGVYKPLTNKVMDDLMYYSRSKFGTKLVTMRDTRSTFLKLIKNNERFFFAFISDQSPAPEKSVFWCDFMGRVVPWYTGSAELAIQSKAVYAFQKITKVSRGKFEQESIIIAQDASEYTVAELMEKFVRLLEANIKENPAHYLWSHKRWKYSNRVNEVINKEGVIIIDRSAKKTE